MQINLKILARFKNRILPENTFEDDDIGIERQDFERIFKPFEQGDNSSARKYGGTGLGLSLTKQLVERHDGFIWAESKGEGKGSAFHFILPIL